MALKKQTQFLSSQTPEEFIANPAKSITLLGMSGVGKTTLADSLPSSNWFKYSGDYRLGTRYLDESILDNIKKKAMEVPFLADLLRTDSIYICHNISINNLHPVSTFLGKIGNPELGGLNFDEFVYRQKLHHDAEFKAMQDVPSFIKKGKEIYGYQHFINDAGGSLSELDDENIYPMLAKNTLIVYLKSTGEMIEELKKRSINHPKPMYYKKDFFQKKVDEYCTLNQSTSHNDIKPNDFIQWVFPALLEDRVPRYEAIADQYGITVNATIIKDIVTEQDFLNVIADALEKKHSST